METGYYSALSPQARPGEEWQLFSEVLGLELHTEGSRLRLFDPKTGQYLRTPQEEAQARRLAEERTAYEAEARRVAEAEVERLRAELARLRGEG